MGYRGHNYEGACEVHVDKHRRGGTARSLWKWMKRRAAIEPGIGHLKREHRMARCRLKGIAGDQFNAILSAAGMNFGKLLKAASRLPAFLRLVVAHLFENLKQVLRTLRSEIFSSNQLDPAFAVLQNRGFSGSTNIYSNFGAAAVMVDLNVMDKASAPVAAANILPENTSAFARPFSRR